MVIVVMVVVVISKVVANGASCCPTQTGTNQSACRAAHLVAYDLTARRAKAPANRRLGLLSIFRGYRSACSTPNPGTDCGASTTTDSITHYASQSAAETATDSSVGGLAGHGALGRQEGKSKCRQGLSHH